VAPSRSRTACRFWRRSAAGCQHAHELQIIHRDLKPENVMLVPRRRGSQEYRAVVMDFGLAKERRAGREVAKLTATGIVLGTPEFMSPEQIRASRSTAAATSTRSASWPSSSSRTAPLRRQVGAGDDDRAAARSAGQAARRAARAPAKLEAVLLKALAIDPAERFGSMSEMAHALDAAVSTGY
jgi:serine/threonine-protein kinase